MRLTFVAEISAARSAWSAASRICIASAGACVAGVPIWPECAGQGTSRAGPGRPGLTETAMRRPPKERGKGCPIPSWRSPQLPNPRDARSGLLELHRVPGTLGATLRRGSAPVGAPRQPPQDTAGANALDRVRFTASERGLAMGMTNLGVPDRHQTCIPLKLEVSWRGVLGALPGPPRSGLSCATMALVVNLQRRRPKTWSEASLHGEPVTFSVLMLTRCGHAALFRAFPHGRRSRSRTVSCPAVWTAVRPVRRALSALADPRPRIRGPCPSPPWR